MSRILIYNTSSMYLYVKLNWAANRFLPVESKDCMNSASYEYTHMSARRGAQFVPTGMPISCWKPFPRRPRTFCQLETLPSTIYYTNVAFLLHSSVFNRNVATSIASRQ